jgi:hypothetical protein
MHSYVVTSGYAGRFEVYSTPATTNVAINGSEEGAQLRLGGSALVAAGNGTVDNIRGLLQFFGAAGASNTATIDDGSDTTGDTVRAEPNLIYNGPGAPYFAAGGSFNYYNVSTVTLLTGSAADTIFAKPSSQNALNVFAGDPSADVLNLAFAAVTNPLFTPNGPSAGGYTFGNAQPLNYTGIESSSIDNAAPAVTAQGFLIDASRQAVEFAFSEDVSASISTAHLTLTNLTTNQAVNRADLAVTYDAGTNRARFTWPGLPAGILPDGDWRAVLSNQVADPFGNWLTQPATLNFFFLQGDANHDRRVNLADFNILAGNFGGTNKTFSQGDYNYDGRVNLQDFNILAGRFGNVLAGPDASSLYSGSPKIDRKRLLDNLLT